MEDKVDHPEDNDADEDASELLAMEAAEAIPPRVEADMLLGDEELQDVIQGLAVQMMKRYVIPMWHVSKLTRLPTCCMSSRNFSRQTACMRTHPGHMIVSRKSKPWPKIPKNSQISLIFSAPESTLSIPLLIDIYSVLLFVGR